MLPLHHRCRQYIYIYILYVITFQKRLRQYFILNINRHKGIQKLIILNMTSTNTAITCYSASILFYTILIVTNISAITSNFSLFTSWSSIFKYLITSFTSWCIYKCCAASITVSASIFKFTATSVLFCAITFRFLFLVLWLCLWWCISSVCTTIVLFCYMNRW